MRYWLDTKFIENGKTIELVSVGIVAEDGRELYLESSEYNIIDASDWVMDNVILHLTGEVCSLAQIAIHVRNFMAPDRYGQPEIWAYDSDCDWIAIRQLFKTVADMPKNWPMFFRDVKQLCDDLGNPKLPKKGASEHHALADAKWTRDAWHFLQAATTERVSDNIAAWETKEREHALERWRHIVQHCKITASGHRLVTHGSHTGHMLATVALCENAEIAKVLAEALERQRKD